MNRHESFGPRACLTLPFVTGRKRGGQMDGRRTRKTGGVFAGILRCDFFGTEKNVDARSSFAAVEWSCRTDSYGYSRLNSSMTCTVISRPASLYNVGPSFLFYKHTLNPRRFHIFLVFSPCFSR